MGYCQCHILDLRNANVHCHYFSDCHVNFKQLLSNIGMDDVMSITITFKLTRLLDKQTNRLSKGGSMWYIMVDRFIFDGLIFVAKMAG